MDGLGLRVLYQAAAGGPGEHDLVMVGWPDAAWHLELVGGDQLAVEPTPSAADLFVLYLDGPLDDELTDDSNGPAGHGSPPAGTGTAGRRSPTRPATARRRAPGPGRAASHFFEIRARAKKVRLAGRSARRRIR